MFCSDCYALQCQRYISVALILRAFILPFRHFLTQWFVFHSIGLHCKQITGQWIFSSIQPKLKNMHEPLL